jgi:hypothetical protein
VGKVVAYFEDVGLALAVDASKGSIYRSSDAPLVVDQFGVTGDNRPLIELKEIITCRRQHVCSHQDRATGQVIEKKEWREREGEREGKKVKQRSSENVDIKKKIV